MHPRNHSALTSGKYLVFNVLVKNENKFYEIDICLFDLRFNVQVNIFSVMSKRSHRFLGFNQYYRELTCLAQGHNGDPCGDRTQDL